MSTQILMPALSPTMDVGKLAKWHVREGDEVHAGDVIAEIETDKATMEVEAIDDGTIGKILVAEGAENVPVNQPIAVLLEEGEGTADSAAPPAERPKAPPVPDTAADAVHDTSPEHVMNRIAEQIRANGHGNGHANGHGERHGRRVAASPLARRLAREHGVDLAALAGSGPHGRIVKADVEHAAAEAPAAPTEPEFAEIAEEAPPHRGELMHAPAKPEAGLSDRQVLALYEPGTYELVPHDTMRRYIAERLTLSKQTIPHFYLAIDCDLEALLAARARLNGMAPHDGPRSFKLSLNDFIVKAMAMALQSVPGANATWTEEGILRHRASDIAVAVALEGGGLHTPVIRSAEVKSLSEISNEMRDLAARARTKRLAPHEYQGGSTTISNLGMYGIDRFDAVINPPQASIMAVGRAEKRPVVKDDALKIATMMSVTLSVDHRVIDGALGAELLAAFKAFIEDPVTMLV
jgi:pyruvate dehydrogenase E2 component (dihydrolipoyllysine-residue acetyltransferase)